MGRPEVKKTPGSNGHGVMKKNEQACLREIELAVGPRRTSTSDPYAYVTFVGAVATSLV